MVAFFARHGFASHHNPFASTPEVSLTIIHAVLRDDSSSRFPVYHRVPNGHQARTICQAVGIPPTTLRTGLGLSQSLFDGWMRGTVVLGNEVLPLGVSVFGIRRLFGVLTHVIASSSLPTPAKERLSA